MSNDQTTPGAKIYQLNKADILRAMAALKIIIEIGVSRGSDIRPSHSRKQTNFGNQSRASFGEKTGKLYAI